MYRFQNNLLVHKTFLFIVWAHKCGWKTFSVYALVEWIVLILFFLRIFRAWTELTSTNTSIKNLNGVRKKSIKMWYFIYIIENNEQPLYAYSKKHFDMFFFVIRQKPLWMAMRFLEKICWKTVKLQVFASRRWKYFILILFRFFALYLEESEIWMGKPIIYNIVFECMSICVMSIYLVLDICRMLIFTKPNQCKMVCLVNKNNYILVKKSYSM